MTAAAKKKSKTKGSKGSGGKYTKIIAMLRKGCTRAEVLKVTGWKAVSMQQVAKAGGLKLTIDKSSRPFVYKVKVEG